MRHVTVKLGALATLLLVGCTVFPEREPRQVYQLPASQLAASQAPGSERVLRVARPAVDEVQGGMDIVVAPDPITLQSYGQARWSAPVPVMLRDHLMEAFLRDGRLARVVSDQQGIAADLQLGGQLRAYRIQYEQNEPMALIVFDAHLIDLAANHLVGSQRFEVREALEDASVEQAVMALWRATERLAGELVEWTVD
ncbi:ABC-type transport auxiliary lipoprotein family protein [Halomonas salipaludis]|uniref:ABC transporter n=1 Tax=Halomonas salipaludis TaxID=2032625 RepID=A0A2A2EWI9_9GAMM|nr:ABC-type transport auxiliary lipoprotein family protein [Halomonas salipaludis]PAU76834.1 ABC transporter [Halomonas salipaludis]